MIDYEFDRKGIIRNYLKSDIFHCYFQEGKHFVKVLYNEQVGTVSTF